MKNSSITRKIILACLICIYGILIGLIGEVVGEDLRIKLTSAGFGTNILYFCLLVCAILSILCIILYERTGNVLKTKRWTIQLLISGIKSLLENPAVSFFRRFLTVNKSFSALCLKLVLVIYVAAVVIAAPIAIYRRISIYYYDSIAENCLDRQDYGCAVSAYEKLIANHPELQDSKLEEYYGRIGDIYNYNLNEYPKAYEYYRSYLKTAERNLYKESCSRIEGSAMSGSPSQTYCSSNVLDKDQESKIKSVQTKLDRVLKLARS